MASVKDNIRAFWVDHKVPIDHANGTSASKNFVVGEGGDANGVCEGAAVAVCWVWDLLARCRDLGQGGIEVEGFPGFVSSNSLLEAGDVNVLE